MNNGNISPKPYSGPFQTSMMEALWKMFNSYKL